MGKSIKGGRNCNNGCSSKRLDAIDGFEEITDPDRSLGEYIRAVKQQENVIQQTTVGGDVTIVQGTDIDDPLILNSITARIELIAEDILRTENTLEVGNLIEIGAGDLTIDFTGITSFLDSTYSTLNGDINIISNQTGTSGDINITATSTGSSTINLTADTVNISSILQANNVNNNVAANGLIVSESPPTPVVRQIDLTTAILQGGVLWYDTGDQEFKPVDNDPTLLPGSPVLSYDNITDTLSWKTVAGVGDDYNTFEVDINTVSKTFLGQLIPADKEYLVVTMWGGGGGGGSISVFPAGAGGGGSGGAIIRYLIPTQGAVSYDVTVGAGGTGAAAGTGAAGSDGENSTLTIGSITLTAYGGAGGLGATVVGTYAAGGGGGGTGSKGNGNIGGDASTIFPIKGPVGGNGGEDDCPGIQGDISFYVISGGGGGGAAPDAGTGVGIGATSGGGTNGGSYLDALPQPIGGTGAGGMGGDGADSASNSNGNNALINTGAGGSGGASDITSVISGGDGGSGLVIVEFL